MRRLDLRIERVVIDGVALTPVERARLRRSLEAQLSDRFSQGDALAALRASDGTAELRAPLRMPPAATPAHWGRGIADAIHGSLANGATGDLSNAHGSSSLQRDDHATATASSRTAAAPERHATVPRDVSPTGGAR